jgi:hypothetical protein
LIHSSFIPAKSVSTQASVSCALGTGQNRNRKRSRHVLSQKNAAASNAGFTFKEQIHNARAHLTP